MNLRPEEDFFFISDLKVYIKMFIKTGKLVKLVWLFDKNSFSIDH